jgi:hypothetical protein
VYTLAKLCVNSSKIVCILQQNYVYTLAKFVCILLAKLCVDLGGPKDCNGRTALYSKALNKVVVRLLVEHNANIDAKDNHR